MEKFLFPDFIDDAKVYEQAVAYWSELCNKVIKKQKKTWKWRRWLTTQFINGTQFMDGNPIYSLINEKENRAIKIIQIKPQEYESVFTVWIDKFGEDSETVDIGVEVLVIYCCLTKKSAKIASKFITEWINPETNREKMEQCLKESVGWVSEA
ncbi:MAG: hypothetical protein KAI50_03040 [Desulfobacterales bacterium]|nr:hypothetical protein [Desulfobacterales bacterium]